MQQLNQEICSLQVWNEEQLSTAASNLFQSMEQSPYSIQAVCSFSGSESESSSPDSYTSSDGGNIQRSIEPQLHYPSHVHLDPGDVKLILPDSMAQLDHIIRNSQQTVGPTYKEVLLKAFSDNSDTLSSSFYQLDIPWTLRKNTKTITDPSECTEEGMKECTIMLKINTQVLCLMQQQFCEQSRSFWELKIGYFAQFAKSPINKLLQIAVSLSKAKWSADHICPMLLAYEALADVLPIIKSFPSSESEDFFSKISDNMREAFRGTFDNIKQFIQCKMKSQQDVTIHPMTYFVIWSMKIFSSHRYLVQFTLAPGDDNNSFGHLLYGVITCWKSALLEHSNLYDLQRQCIFLLNNTEHFSRKTDYLRDELLSDRELIAEHDDESRSFYNNWIEKYLEDVCTPAKACLNCNYRWRSLHPSLVAFTSKFKETFGRQKTWKVPDVDLRKKLRDEIENCILPEYESSLARYSNSGFFSCSCLRRDLPQDIYTAESLKRKVQGLFEG